MANHGARLSRHIERQGINKIEAFLDQCLSLENLIDPWAPFNGRAPVRDEEAEEDRVPDSVPRLRAKEYMESFINPAEYIEAQKKKMVAQREQSHRVPEQPERDILKFLLDHAPLERWERDVLEIIRDEAYYFAPQAMTKIMNEGWATYWHSKIMTERALRASEIIDYADHASGVTASAPGQLNPYKLGVELYRHIEERWDKGQFGKEWDECTDMAARKSWDRRLGLGKKKIFEVRKLYNDITFVDEFFTEEFCRGNKFFSFGFNERSGNWEIESREFKKVKDKLLFRLTNFGQPFIYVEDGNFENRGELMLKHKHEGVDLKMDHARDTLEALARVWKRPVNILTRVDGKGKLMRFDGRDHSEKGADYSDK
jgi:stage V sporulation protein R